MLRHSRTLDVILRTNRLRESKTYREKRKTISFHSRQSRTFLVSDGLVLISWLVPEIALGSHEDKWRVGAVVVDLGEPLAHILETGAIDAGEDNAEDVRARIGQRTQAIVLRTARRVPQA